ncbi:lipoprotein-anchoring transpeptidase ErfK/SrfK [Devosia sp. UYZn731]|uniref:L,D-transpeptidase n=1 Tax=Devosia sp. UYZn731 TaxID=3156345 RepID=UPI0033997B99
MNMLLTRRHFVLGASSLASLALAGCATSTPHPVDLPPQIPANVREMYAALPLERFPIPSAQIALVDPLYWRQEVANTTGEAAGTVVVDTPNRLLYWTMPNGRAMRYGVGIGRDGFAWAGRARIAYKREWPRWTPPATMIERQPELERYRHGMEPGLDNPLGPRALYIHNREGDTLYRIHGNMDARTIGQAVSSGCVRLLFQDVIDLYQRVPDGSPIVVIQ